MSAIWWAPRWRAAGSWEPSCPFSAAQWQPTYALYYPAFTGTTSDNESDGYEARLVANLKRKWRLIANYSYTHSASTNTFSREIPWYGLKPAGAQLRARGQPELHRPVCDRPCGLCSGWHGREVDSF